ncbi:ribosome maturation protein RimP [Oceanococcus atlanticus]|uniref:Ribosome maturation factor RimP n=1 Tax=Oceanococcus atlanticus TaxID=1317117 RepID=A0A1Y1SCV4_9GAMM|nr:ribosome maturation factor RimP [Oceanococcus atlanticus]ORE86441.1 ribosome maturation protein RimP [Oceanococcus atlanticus]RZO85718.1 MAG: ribosome maturation factor RimP [Oceanococcus sp.]
MRGLIDNLQQMLEPAVAGLGYDLLCVELQGTGTDAVLRIYIDSAQGIGVEDCAKVSREVSALLDVDDPIESAYRLEVSSPGLDRPLVKTQHFVEFLGREAKLKLRIPFEGRRNFRGKLLECDGETVAIEVDQERFDVPFADIERARLVPVFD